MRHSGLLQEHDALTNADDVGWVYDDLSSFTEAAQRFLAQGLARGDRLLCVGDGLAEEFRLAGEPFGSLTELVARGALSFRPVSGAYADGRVMRADEQRACYDAAVRSAQDAGYRGLRIVAELTALAGSETARAGLVTWEHVADEYIASGSGMAALCAYARSGLSDEALADVAAVHPQVHAPHQPPSFRIWFDGPRAALAGTVDTFAADRLARVLAGSPVLGPVASLDLSGLEVVDAAGARALARWAAPLVGRGAAVHLPGAPSPLVRIWSLLGLHRRAPVVFAEPA